MRKYFAEPKSTGWIVKVQLDLSNSAKKSDLQNAIGVNTSDFSKKTI